MWKWLLITWAMATPLVQLPTFHESRYVAVTVAFSTSVSRWLAATRVEERRGAHMKAASELSCAKLRWEALPAEQRTTQRVLDQLVCEAERYLESTLPPSLKEESKQEGGDEPQAAKAAKAESEREKEEEDALIEAMVAEAAKKQ